MTDETTKPVVTQADRDLFKWIIDADEEASEQIDAGLWYTHECERLAAHRLASQAVVSQDLVPVAWQPIETAPMDGTPFLATLLVTNNKTGKQWWEPNVIWATEDDSEWNRGWDFSSYTHWMPLPTPETPLYPASAIEAAQIAARNDALDEAANIANNEGYLNAEFPYDRARMHVAAAIRSLRTPSQHQEEQ